MKKLILTLLVFSLASGSFAIDRSSEIALIESGEAMIAQKSELLNEILNLKDQIEEKKNSRLLNYAGVVSTGIVLVYSLSGYKKYLRGDSFTGLYRLFFGTVGSIAAVGTGYNTYKISLKNSDIKNFEIILNQKIDELEDQITKTKVLINTLEK